MTDSGEKEDLVLLPVKVHLVGIGGVPAGGAGALGDGGLEVEVWGGEGGGAAAGGVGRGSAVEGEEGGAAVEEGWRRDGEPRWPSRLH